MSGASEESAVPANANTAPEMTTMIASITQAVTRPVRNPAQPVSRVGSSAAANPAAGSVAAVSADARSAVITFLFVTCCVR